MKTGTHPYHVACAVPKNICGLILLAAFAIAPLSAAADPGSQASDKPALTREQLNLEISDLRASGAVTRVPPIFTEANGTVSFYFGKVFVRSQARPDLADDPTRIPIETEMQLQALKSYVDSNRSLSAFWLPYLNLATSTVDSMLADIAVAKSTDDIRSKLLDDQANTDAILLQALQIYATKNHLKLKGSAEKRGELVTIKFSSDPPGAQIKLVQGFLYEASHGKIDESLWLDVSGGNKVDLFAGDWQVKRRWSSSEPWQLGLEPLTRSGDFKISRVRP